MTENDLKGNNSYINGEIIFITMTENDFTPD